MKQISVVIPVYGQWELVKRNIEALLQFDRKFIFEIIVIDDCSPEPNPFQFDKNYVSVIRNTSNSGYTQTVNTGLRKAVSEQILLLDSDAYLVEPIVENILGEFAKNVNIGGIGFRTIDKAGIRTGSACFQPSVLGFILGQQLEARLNWLFSATKREVLPYSCSVAFSKKCLEEMDYFDQKLFPVLDADLDLGMRIHQSNWELLFNDEIKLSHSGGNSYKINYKRVLLFYQSRWQLLKKHSYLKLPKFTKRLVLLRLHLELLLLKLICLIKKSDGRMQEKKEGRKIIIQTVAAFTTF